MHLSLITSKKFALLAVLGLSLLAFGLILATPEPSAAQPCNPGPCPSGQPYTTSTAWGMGVDCDAAALDLTGNLYDEAAGTCGNRLVLVCNYEEVEVTACFYDSMKGSYRTDGYAKYNCAQCQGVSP